VKADPTAADTVAVVTASESAVAAPPGLVRVDEAFPEVDLLTVAVDERLDDDGFIVPGLGDAGDRAFRTK